MSEPFIAGDTSKSIDVMFYDTSSTTGAGLSGLAYNTPNLKAYYRKGATGTATAITLATQTVGGAWTSGGFVEVDATNMKGVCRFDIPNAAIDTEGYTTFYFYGAANMQSTCVRVDCRPAAVDVRKYGGTAGTFSGGRPEVNATHWAGTAAGSATVRSDLRTILGTSLSELGSGRLAAAFSAMFDVASPVFTVACVNQTGDSFSRIGATGSGLTSLAPASTALSSGTWTAQRAGYLDNLSGGASGGVKLADGVTHGGTTASVVLQYVLVSNPSGIGVDVTGSTYAVKKNGQTQAGEWIIGANAGPAVKLELQNGNIANIQGNLTGKVLGGGTSTIVGVGAWAAGYTGENIVTTLEAYGDANWVDSGSSAASQISVYPVSYFINDGCTDPKDGTPLYAPLGSRQTFVITAYSVDSNGVETAIDLTGKSLRVVIENSSGTDVEVLTSAANEISISGTSCSFTTFDANATKMVGYWTLEELIGGDPQELKSGRYYVYHRATKDLTP